MQSHLWTIWFLIYYSPPLHWWALSFFCQGNNLAPVYLRYVNMLFLFWALTRSIVFPEIKHRGVFNIIFFIRQGNTSYLYSLSSFFCCSSEHFMTLAKFRLISYFSILSTSFPGWFTGACLDVFLCEEPAEEPTHVRPESLQDSPKGAQESLQSSWCVPTGQDTRLGKILPCAGSLTHKTSSSEQWGRSRCHGQLLSLPGAGSPEPWQGALRPQDGWEVPGNHGMENNVDLYLLLYFSMVPPKSLLRHSIL